MPTASEAAITNLTEGVRHQFQVWRAEGALTPADEGLIVGAWVPTGPSWSDVSASVSGRSGIQIGANNDITFRVRNHDRNQWPDDRAVAIVGRHWDGTAFSAWYVVGWGFINGAGAQEQERFNQLGEVKLTYISRFQKYPTRPLRFGVRNIATAGSIAASSAILATPSQESPLEYISQADVAGARIIDGAANTVSVADVIADPTRPTLGDTVKPRILRFAAHRTTRGIGDGANPIWVEIWAGHNSIPWGTTWTGIPDMYNVGAGEGQPAVRDEPGKIKTEVIDYGTYKAFKVTSRQNADPKRDTWIQWILGGLNVGLPFRVELEVRAIGAYSIGKAINLSVTTADPAGSSRQNVPALVLGSSWQSYAFDFDDSGAYGGAKLAIKTIPGDLVGADVVYEIRNFAIWFGWDGDIWSTTDKLYLAMDDGNGHERWVRIAWNLDKSGNVRIPPKKSIIICDDLATFKAKYDPGAAQVYQMRDVFPEWFFGPNVGRMWLAICSTPPNMNDLDTAPASIDLLDQIDFVTRPDLVWSPEQGMVRASPLGTGSLAVETFPRPGLDQQFGSAYWWVDLGAYSPSTLARDVGIGDNYIPVSDPSRYAATGIVRVDSENLTYTAKEDEYLYVPAGATAAHTLGTLVYPRLDGNADTGTNNQTGPMVSRIMLRRKPGTPYIESGAVLYSNLSAPRDPSDPGNVVGAKWERHPDWKLLTRWANNTQDVIDAIPPLAAVPGGFANVVQARHWAIVVDRMQRYNGLPQRAKLNEFIILEYVPDAGVAGGYNNPAAADFVGAIGHLLTQYGGVPLAKFLPQIDHSPIGDTSVASTNVQGAITSLIGNNHLAVYNDPMNAIILGAVPGSHLYRPGAPEFTWTRSNTRGQKIGGNWDEAHKVSKVIVWAVEPSTLRHYTFQYPEVPYILGNTIELKDVYIGTRDQGRMIARAVFLIGQARRRIRVEAGAVPWVRLNQRHAVNLPGLDSGGAWGGVSFYVRDYSIRIGVTERGIVTWNTSVELAELPQ